MSRLVLVAALAASSVLVALEADAWAQGAPVASDQSVVEPRDTGAAAPGRAGSHQADAERTTTAGWGARTATRSSRKARSKSRRRTRRRRRSREVTATVDVSVGPSFYTFGNPVLDGGIFSGPVYEDQPVHYGLRFDAAAILDYEFFLKNRDLVPRQYRGMIQRDTEIRYAPAIVALIPRNLYISPKTNNTGVYGATWELMRLGLTLFKNASTQLSAGAGVLATYAYIDSDAFESTHFLRPGMSLGLNLGTMFNDTFGMSIGWDSNFYLPQDIGGGILEGSSDDALWHIGEGFLMFHYRFPYTTRI